MSWDPTSRIFKIKSLKKNESEILNVVNKLNKNLTDKFTIDKEYNGKELVISLDEAGWTKHGSFSNGNNYNQQKFIKDILAIDKENTIIYEEPYSYLDNGNQMYFYKDNEFISIDEKTYKFEQCKNKEQIIKMIKQDFSYFEKLSKEDQLDFDYQMASLEADYGSIAWEYGSRYQDMLYSDEFLDREETVRAIFKFGGRFQLFKNRVKDIYKNDDKLMKECLKLRPGYIICLPFKFRDDKELILSLIEISKKNKNNYHENDLSLRNISKRLRNDKKVVINFIKYEPREFTYASERLKKDYDMCQLYLKYDSDLANIKNKEILNDKKIILSIFNQGPVYDEYRLISNNLKNDKDILIAWLLQQYKIGKYNITNNQLKTYQEKLVKMNMKELTLYALKNNILFNISYVGSNLLNDKDFIKKYAKLKNRNYDYFELGEKICEDQELVIELLKKGFSFKLESKLLKNKKFLIENIELIPYYLFDKLDDDIKNDYDIAKIFLEKYGYYILDLKDELKNDKEIRKIALNNWEIREWYEPREDDIYYNNRASLKEFKKFIDIDNDDLFGVIKLNPRLLEEMPELLERYKDDKEFFLKIFELGNFGTFKYVNHLFKDDKEIALKAIKDNIDNYQYLSDSLKDDYDIVKEMIIQKPDSIFLVSNKYRDNEELILLSNKGLKKEKKNKYYNGKKSYPLEKISERLQQDKEFIAKLLEIDSNMSIEDMYISNYDKDEKIYSFNLTVPNFLKDNLKIIKYLYFRLGVINDIDEYPECKTVKELYSKLSQENIWIPCFKDELGENASFGFKFMLPTNKIDDTDSNLNQETNNVNQELEKIDYLDTKNEESISLYNDSKDNNFIETESKELDTTNEIKLFDYELEMVNPNLKKEVYILDDEFKEEYQKIYICEDIYDDSYDTIKLFDNEVYDPMNYDDSDVSESDYLIDESNMFDYNFY